MNWKLHTFFALLIFAGVARAHERYDFYRSPRQMAMGGASIGVVNDQTALIHNPAGLGRLRDVYLTLADPVLAIGDQDSTIAGGPTLIPNMMDMQPALDQLQVNPAHLG